MSAEQVREIEKNIKEAQRFIEIQESVDRLRSNRDFKKIILEGYFKDEAVRLVHLKSDTNMQSDHLQKMITRDLDAIGSLSAYFAAIEQEARRARHAIQAGNEALEELAEEELNNG